MATRRSESYVVKLRTSSQAGQCGRSRCHNCTVHSESEFRINKLLARRHGNGSSIFTTLVDAVVFGEHCEWLAIIERYESGGRLDDAMGEWDSSCFSPWIESGTAPERTPTHPLDLRCIIHQLLSILAILQEKPTIIHGDLRTQQLLLRSPWRSASCSTNSTFRPHVLLSDFHLAIPYSETLASKRLQEHVAYREPDRTWPPEATLAWLNFCSGQGRCAQVRPNFSDFHATSSSWDSWQLGNLIWELIGGGSVLPELKSLISQCKTHRLQTVQDSADAKVHHPRVESTHAMDVACARWHFNKAADAFDIGSDNVLQHQREAIEMVTRTSVGAPWLEGYSQLGTSGAILLSQLLERNPLNRIQPEVALRSPFFASLDPSCPSHPSQAPRTKQRMVWEQL